jgi:hypothetical protein
LRHGLNIPVWSDAALAPQAEAIALRIAGPHADAEILDYARQIGEAQVDLNRVRSLRREVIARMLSQPRLTVRSPHCSRSGSLIGSLIG